MIRTSSSSRTVEIAYMMTVPGAFREILPGFWPWLLVCVVSGRGVGLDVV